MTSDDLLPTLGRLWQRLAADSEAWAEFSAPEQDALVIDSLIDTVLDVGFAQFFLGPNGDQILRAQAILQTAGRPDLADVAGRACAVFPADVEVTDRAARINFLASVAGLGEPPAGTLTEQQWHETSAAMLHAAEPLFASVDRAFEDALDRDGFESMVSRILTSH